MKFVALRYPVRTEFRDESILNGKLPSSDKMPKVKTKILYEGNKLDSDIRLKGDRITHFEKDKSSFKITLADEDKIFGIKKKYS